MRIFLAGATGATGSLVARTLLDRGHTVVAVVRSTDRIPGHLRSQPQLELTEAGILDLSVHKLAKLTRDCEAIVSCLGHNLSFKGLFFPPHRLVMKATQRLLQAARINGGETNPKFILMSSAGVRNPDANERVSFAQHLIVLALKLLLPPHADNEAAAAFLRNIPTNDSGSSEWVAVRPDALVDAPDVSPYSIHASPTRSAIFNSGKTSRVNVADFMANLIEQDDLWNQWKGRMPLVYNSDSSA